MGIAWNPHVALAFGLEWFGCWSIAKSHDLCDMKVLVHLFPIHPDYSLSQNIHLTSYMRYLVVLYTLLRYHVATHQPVPVGILSCSQHQYGCSKSYTDTDCKTNIQHAYCTVSLYLSTHLKMFTYTGFGLCTSIPDLSILFLTNDLDSILFSFQNESCHFGGVQIFAEYSDQVQCLCNSGSRCWGEKLSDKPTKKGEGKKVNL